MEPVDVLVLEREAEVGGKYARELRRAAPWRWAARPLQLGARRGGELLERFERRDRIRNSRLPAGSMEAPPRRPRRRSVTRVRRVPSLVRDQIVLRLRDIDLSLHHVELRHGPGLEARLRLLHEVLRVIREPAGPRGAASPRAASRTPARSARRLPSCQGQAGLGGLLTAVAATAALAELSRERNVTPMLWSLPVPRSGSKGGSAP